MARVYSFFLVLLTIRPTVGISSTFLWSVTNSTLTEKRVPRYCPKVIFYNNATLANQTVGEEYAGVIQNAFINMDEVLEENSFYWDDLLTGIRWASNETISNKLEPCIVVVSLVYNSRQYDEVLDDKVRNQFRHHLTDLLSFNTPVRSRHLVLMRVSEEFSFCTKGPKYLTRLVPQWEMLLFDFFQEARVIQGLFHDSDEPYLKVTKETGKWKWVCEDLMERLAWERSCKQNDTCRAENPGVWEWSPDYKPILNCTLGFRPRH